MFEITSSPEEAWDKFSVLANMSMDEALEKVMGNMELSAIAALTGIHWIFTLELLAREGHERRQEKWGLDLPQDDIVSSRDRLRDLIRSITGTDELFDGICAGGVDTTSLTLTSKDFGAMVMLGVGLVVKPEDGSTPPFNVIRAILMSAIRMTQTAVVSMAPSDPTEIN